MSSKSSTKTRAKKVTVKTASKKRVAKPRANKTKKEVVKTEPTKSPAILSSKQVLAEISREPLGHIMAEHKLRDAGFRGEVTTDKELLDKYSTDESIFSIRPQMVVQPKSKKDVEIAVAVLSAETGRFPGLSLTPRAAGTGLSGGSLTDSIVIDVVTHLNSIDKVTKTGEKVTITCEPGVIWTEADKALKKYDSYLPSFPASKHICTVGGSVANNAAGPDSLRYGHCADWIESLDVVLRDGHTYTVKPLSFKEYKKLIKSDNELARIAREIFDLIAKNETTIKRAKPKTQKNTAGYSLWDVIDTSVAKFRRGNGTFDLTRLLAGSQGTLGIITSITMRAESIATDGHLVVVPVFDLASAGKVVVEVLKYDPRNIEIFDGFTYEAAMNNPQFFRSRLPSLRYYRVLLSLYTNFHVRWRRRLPEFVLLITLDENSHGKLKEVVDALRKKGGKTARLITNDYESEMFWQLRGASFMLAKLLDPKKRPAPFLEDMTVPPQHLAKFFADIKYLLKKYRITAAVHGHGGNGHFHFYPLLDFTNKTTPNLITKMTEEFFNTAIKYDGNICGEHNDGIIRTPYLNKMFSRSALALFKDVEHIFDPDDIFNPGKKVNPRFDIQSSVRKTN